jgi:hypothetical protein
MTTVEVEACNEFNVALTAKENLNLVENLVNQDYDPITTSMPSLLGMEEWYGLCSPIFHLQVLDGDNQEWYDWNDIQKTIM